MRVGFMKRRLIVSVLFCLAWTGQVLAQTTACTYQGKLTDAGAPANGLYDLKIQLYDAPTGGTPLGAQVKDDVTVTQGIFTVTLDFGSNVFAPGEGRFLEIAVRPGASTSG